jgi:hypothetical protein
MKDDENISLVLIVIWKKRIKRLRDGKNNVKRIYTCLLELTYLKIHTCFVLVFDFFFFFFFVSRIFYFIMSL